VLNREPIMPPKYFWLQKRIEVIVYFLLSLLVYRFF